MRHSLVHVESIFFFMQLQDNLDRTNLTDNSSICRTDLCRDKNALAKCLEFYSLERLHRSLRLPALVQANGSSTDLLVTVVWIEVCIRSSLVHGSSPRR